MLPECCVIKLACSVADISVSSLGPGSECKIDYKEQGRDLVIIM